MDWALVYWPHAIYQVLVIGVGLLLTGEDGCSHLLRNMIWTRKWSRQNAEGSVFFLKACSNVPNQPEQKRSWRHQLYTKGDGNREQVSPGWLGIQAVEISKGRRIIIPKEHVVFVWMAQLPWNLIYPRAESGALIQAWSWDHGRLYKLNWVKG